MILLLVVIVIFISETTMRAWRVIDYELKVKQGYPLLQNSSSTVPVVLDLKLKF